MTLYHGILAFLITCLGVASIGPQLAQAQECVTPPIDECPLLYESHCEDPNFRSIRKNRLYCIKITQQTAVNQDSCADYDPTSCQTVQQETAIGDPSEVAIGRLHDMKCPEFDQLFDGRGDHTDSVRSGFNSIKQQCLAKESNIYHRSVEVKDNLLTMNIVQEGDRLRQAFPTDEQLEEIPGPEDICTYQIPKISKPAEWNALAKRFETFRSSIEQLGSCRIWHELAANCIYQAKLNNSEDPIAQRFHAYKKWVDESQGLFGELERLYEKAELTQSKLNRRKSVSCN